jgi:hypothetical protein
MERAVARRNVVLQAMAESGALTEEEATAARAEGGPRGRAAEGRGYGAYFKEQVRLQLVEQFGWERVYNGGLRVYTTLDIEMQKAAEQAVNDSLERLEAQRARLEARGRRGAAKPARTTVPRRSRHCRPRSSPSIPNGRGARARRRPRLRGEPVQPRRAGAPPAGLGLQAVRLRRGPRAGTLAGLGHRSPERAAVDPRRRMGAGGRSTGATSMTLRTALRTSSNRAAVRLLERVGIAPTVDYAQDMGVGRCRRYPRWRSARAR